MSEKVKEYLPGLSAAIIILSISKQFLYYENFNIPIIHFLGLSELPLLVADDILITCIVVLFIFAEIFIITNIIDVADPNESLESSKEKEILPPPKKWSRKKKMIFFTISASIFVVSLLFIVDSKSITFTAKIYWIISITYFAFGIVVGFVTKRFFEIVRKKENHFYVLLTFAIIMEVMICVKEIKHVERGKFTGTTIITDQKNYYSSDTAYYIGQTEKYVFFFHKRDSSTTVIPIGDVKRLELKKH